jgi:predicted nucleotidyltransferase component of viral defense system
MVIIMITSNPMQLKAFIKKMADEKRMSAQLVMQNYMLERLLERISLSKHMNNFIIKGGFLISAIVGIDSRATMDMDATVKGLPLTHESVLKTFEEICDITVADDVSFSILKITDIRENANYPGIRIHMVANYPPLAVPLKVDISAGEKITPHEIEYSYKLLFDNRSITIMAYTLETIFAEKLETVLSRNIANTRPRDFYDIHILYILRKTDCDIAILRKALSETATERGSLNAIEYYQKIIEDIRGNIQMQKFWDEYCQEFSYAKDITFNDTCDTILHIMRLIKENEKYLSVSSTTSVL